MSKPKTTTTKRDRIAPFNPGSETSRMAAESVQDTRQAKGAEILLYMMSKTIGKTCDDIEMDLKMLHQSVSARLNELEGADCIAKIGLNRRTRSGKMAEVYKPTTMASVERYARYLKQKRIQNERLAAVRLAEKAVLSTAYDYGRKPTVRKLELLREAALALDKEHRDYLSLVR